MARDRTAISGIPPICLFHAESCAAPIYSRLLTDGIISHDGLLRFTSSGTRLNTSRKNTIKVLPRDLEFINLVPGLVGVARDEDLKLFWCTQWFSKRIEENLKGTPIIGSTLRDFLPETAAREREEINEHVIRTGEVNSHYQFSADMRVLSTIFPLDEEAFGHKGVLAVIKDAPVNVRLNTDEEIRVLSSPHLGKLGALSQRELEVLHYLAKGIKTSRIAEDLHRAVKTVENHINSIHTKLGTTSRAELVRYTSERGIQSFTDEEWMNIVRGARLARQESGEESRS